MKRPQFVVVVVNA